MTSDYVKSEISKIVENTDYEFPLNLSMAAAWIAAHYKAENIKIYNAKNFSSLADNYILCSVQNATQASALADELVRIMREHKARPLSVEGTTDGQWVLVDLGDIIIHIFNSEARSIYDLDELWFKLPQIKIPEEFYLSSHVRPEPTKKEKETENDEDYF